MFHKIGLSVRNRFSLLIYALGYIGRLITASFLFLIHAKKASRKILVMQLLFTFVEALPICCILAIGIGTSILLLGNNFLLSIGQANLTYTLMALIIVREFGPILVAFVVTARSATAIATEISSNVVNHEIEAYIATGIDPISHLAAPRFLGVTLSTFFLSIYFSIFGLIFPVFVVQFITPVNIGDYFNNLFSSIEIKMVFISILKSLIFGMLISSSATFYGFNSGRASTEIPLAALRAVSSVFVLIILADAFITVLSYIL